MNLTTKFSLAFSGIILFMGYISFYGIYSFQYDILEQDITEKLENAAESHLDKLDRMFYERLNDLEILSTNPVFLAKNAPVAQVHRQLESFLIRYPQYASVSYFDMNRMLIASAGPSLGTYKRHPLTEYWPDILAGRDNVVNISMSASLKLPTLHFVNRVIDKKGKTLGVLVARIPSSELYGLMSESKDGNPVSAKYELDILDRAGTILYSNHDKDAILKGVDEDFELIREALPAVRTAGSLTEIHQQAHSMENKVLMVFAKEQGYRSFKGNNWILKIAHPAEDAFAPVAALSRQIFIFLLCVSLIGIATILTVLLVTVVRPIRKLNSATTRLGQGELNARVAVESSDEIGGLAKSFNAMAANLKDAREQLSQAADMALARARLAENKIIEVSEETQQQIGRELHDDLGQQLTGIAFMTEVLRQHLRSENHPEVENASKITSLVNEAIAKANNLAHGLHPVEMKESGLRPMLMRLAGNTKSIYGIDCEFTCNCEDEPTMNAPLANTNLFRIVQEAVHNAVKHAAATKITINMVSTPETLSIDVIDNGRGIDARPDAETHNGLGMRTMQYRASLLKATLNIAGQPGGGTRVGIILSPRALAT